MANMTVTNYSGGFTIKGPEFRDETFAFAAADTIAAGTILAREAATGKLKPFDSGGAGGLEIPTAVLVYSVAADAAGDVAIRPAISGVVRQDELIVHGGAVDIAAVAAVLANSQIIVVNGADNLAVLDNQ